MAPRLRSAAAAALALGALCACTTPEPSRELYAWTDAEGNVRYTPFPERIPAAREHTREVVSRDTRPVDRSAAPPRVEPAAPAAAPRTASAPAATPAPAPPDPLDARIAALEAQVAADEELLKALISDPSRAGALRSAPEMKEIGERLPRLQAELAALRAERAARSPDDGEADAAPDDDDDGF